MRRPREACFPPQRQLAYGAWLASFQNPSFGSLAVTPLRAASSFAPPLCRYAVAVSQGNAQAALAFQFLHEVVKVLKNYFGDFTEVRGACACVCACA